MLLDRLRNDGHVRSNRIPHQSIAPMDHDPSLQAVPKSRHFHILLHGRHARLLHSGRDRQNPNLLADPKFLEAGDRRILSQRGGHHHGRRSDKRSQRPYYSHAADAVDNETSNAV